MSLDRRFARTLRSASRAFDVIAEAGRWSISWSYDPTRPLSWSAAHRAKLNQEESMTQNPSTKLPSSLDQSGVPAALRVQILATEHWSLLGTRGMTWNEIFSRTGTFLTILSATVVALSLVAQATGFGADFRVFALLVLPVVLLVGLATYIRLVED